MKDKILTILELINDYGEKKLKEYEENHPNEDSFINGHIFLAIKEDRRTKIGKILTSLEDDNDIFDLSYDEYNHCYRVYFKKILFHKPYTAVNYAYEKSKIKLDFLIELNTHIYFKLD